MVGNSPRRDWVVRYAAVLFTVVAGVAVAQEVVPHEHPEAHAAQVVCTPRPPVQVQTAEQGVNLNVTFAATGTGNAIQRTVVQQSTNARVEVASNYLSARLHPLVAQDAMTAQFVITDACGDWPTLAGRGPRTGTATTTGTPAPIATPTPTPTSTATRTVTPTYTATATPTSTPKVLLSATITVPPTATSTPGTTGLIEGVPLCADHDPTRWHRLVERNADGTIRCTYGHEHKDDPRVQDHLFGPLSYGTIGLPWAALNAVGSLETHRTFGWAVVEATGSKRDKCLTGFTDASFTDLRIQTHVGYNGATSRDHSYHLQGQTCGRGDRVAGRLSVGGHLDFGALYIDSPQCPVQRVALQSDIIRPLLNTSLQRLHGGYPNCPRPDMTWYGANGAIATGAPRVVVNVGVRREDWGLIDPASPSTLHLTDPANANGSRQEPAHLVSVLLASDWDALDGVQDGRVTYQGFTDRWGNLVGNCAPVGMDCVPLWLDRVRTGIEHQFRADVASIGEREYDVASPVTGKSLIQYPN